MREFAESSDLKVAQQCYGSDPFSNDEEVGYWKEVYLGCLVISNLVSLVAICD